MSNPAVSLTPRQHQVLELRARGLLYKEIAAELGISLHTVRFHMVCLLEKLGASNSMEAVHYSVAYRRALGDGQSVKR